VTVKVFPFCMIGWELGALAPDGCDVHATLCGALVSWSLKVIVEPAATLSVAGEKLRAVFEPTPCGITTVYEPPPAELEDDEDVEEALVAVILLVVLEDVVVLDEVLDLELLLIVVDDVAVAEELVALEVVLLAVLVADELVLLAVVVGVPEPFVVHQLVVHVGVAVLVLLE
jgi:hypothetical protein